MTTPQRQDRLRLRPARSTADDVLAASTCPASSRSSPAATPASGWRRRARSRRRRATSSCPRGGRGTRAGGARGHRRRRGRTSSTSATWTACAPSPSASSPPGARVDFVINNAGDHGLPGDARRARAGRRSSPPTTSATSRWSTCSGRRSPRTAAPASSRCPRAATSRSPIRWDDVHFEHGYDKWEAYGQAKTANVLFAVAPRRARQGRRRARVRGAPRRHPDPAAAPPAARGDGRAPAGSTRRATARRRSSRRREQGAATAGVGGHLAAARRHGRRLLRGLRHRRARRAPRTRPRGVAPYAVDPDEAARLWAVSAELTGVDALAASGSEV